MRDYKEWSVSGQDFLDTLNACYAWVSAQGIDLGNPSSWPEEVTAKAEKVNAFFTRLQNDGVLENLNLVSPDQDYLFGCSAAISKVFWEMGDVLLEPFERVGSFVPNVCLGVFLKGEALRSQHATELHFYEIALKQKVSYQGEVVDLEGEELLEFYRAEERARIEGYELPHPNTGKVGTRWSDSEVSVTYTLIESDKPSEQRERAFLGAPEVNSMRITEFVPVSDLDMAEESFVNRCALTLMTTQKLTEMDVELYATAFYDRFIRDFKAKMVSSKVWGV